MTTPGRENVDSKLPPHICDGKECANPSDSCPCNCHFDFFDWASEAIRLEGELSSLRAENERLEKDTQMLDIRATEAQVMVIRLRGALEEYGDHKSSCRAFIGSGRLKGPCDCGYLKALTGTENNGEDK